MEGLSSTKTKEVSLPLPKSLDTRIYVRVSQLEKASVILLSTATAEELGTAVPMGSFVYALPDRFNEKQPLATTLFAHEPTIEFTTRVARSIARKSRAPVYVTNSISFRDAGMGGTVEEEMEALQNVIGVICTSLGC